MHRLLFVTLAVLAVLAPACSGDDDELPTPTVTLSPAATEATEATATPTAAPAAAATATPDPTPAETVLHSTELIDVGSGDAVSLYERPGPRWALAYFSPDGLRALVIKFGDATEAVEYDLEGREVARVPFEPPCRTTREELDGQMHTVFECVEDIGPYAGFLAPPGYDVEQAWALYPVSDGRPTVVPYSPPGYDQWAVNLRTGERRLLQAGMQSCGGCDGGPQAPGWSPSGRYFGFGETGPLNRIFVHDFEQATTLELTLDDGTSAGAARWSPLGDRLLRPMSGGVVLADVGGGNAVAFAGMEFPAYFDYSGRLVYSPGYLMWPAGPPSGQRASTIVADSSTGDVLAELDGLPPYLNFWREMYPVALAPDGSVVAALEYARDCPGTAVYAGDQRIACIEQGEGATISPDARTVALARVTSGSTEPLFRYDRDRTFEIVLFDIETRTERVVSRDTVGRQPPQLTWSPDSRHLLVSWPVYSGL